MTKILRFYKRLSLFCIAALISNSIISQDWKVYPYEPDGSLISFPADEGRHATEPVEWWYTVGHLTGTSGTNYSFMLTYFYAPQGPYQGFRIFNVSNDDTGEFFASTEPVNYAVLSEDSLNLLAKTGFLGTGTEYWRNKTNSSGMIPFEYELNATSANGALMLDFVAEKPPLILGGDGLFDQGQSNYTYYYSLTKNSVTGTFTFNGITETVSGTSWIDRQYGTFNPSTGEKYEWFCLQLSNGMDINFWELFTEENTIPNDPKYKNFSVYVDENNSYTNIDFTIERLGYDFTDDNQKCYAQKWRITSPINNIDIEVSTLHNDTEVQIPFRFYEGAITAAGSVNGTAVTGIGFAELLHSYSHPSITLEQPENDLWNTSVPVNWTLNSNDDGRPVLYDLFYSNDNMATYNTIASALSETSYVWEDVPLDNGETFRFKISAYSIDTTLSGDDISGSDILYESLTTMESFYGSDPELKLYPNPVKDVLTIQVQKHRAIEDWQILTLSGKEIFSDSGSPQNVKTIHTTGLAKGMYVLKITFTNKQTSNQLIHIQ